MPRILTILAVATLCLDASTAAAWTHKRTPNGATVRWSRAVVSVRLSPEVRDLTADVGGVALDAAAEWQGVPDVPLLIVEDAPAQPRGMVDGVTGIYLPDEWTYEPGRLAVTVSRYVTETGELLDADILLNPAFFPGRYDLGRLLSHEFGHVLGLGESEVPAAAMFATIPPGGRLRPLDRDDVQGVTALYAGVRLDRTLDSPSCSANGGSGERSPVHALLMAMFALAYRRQRSMQRAR